MTIFNLDGNSPQTITGTSSGDSYIINTAIDKQVGFNIQGMGGNDYFEIDQAGSCTIDGGAGDDHIEIFDGDGNNNTILFGRGDGRDVLGSSQPLTTIKFKTGIRPEDLILTQVSNNIHVSINGTSDLISILGTVPVVNANDRPNFRF